MVRSALSFMQFIVSTLEQKYVANNGKKTMHLLNTIKQYLFKYLRGFSPPLEKTYEKTTVLQSLLIAKSNRSKERVKCLSEVEFSGFSQWGEDGIIDWLIEKLPEIPKTFIEFGVEDYRESNTRLLLHLRNWRGFVMDGSAEHISNIKRQDVSWRYDLTASCAFIDRENITQLIAASGLSGNIGLMSVDIDGNDYWVWQAIDTVNPAIVVCEYNAVFGDLHQISVPYQADFQRTHAHYSNLYFGASLPALMELANQKGYVFIGTNSNGCNAFFVQKDLAPAVMNSITEIKAFPSSIREARDSAGNLSFARGIERVEIIRHLPVFDFKTKSIRLLGDIGNLYSSEWLQES